VLPNHLIASVGPFEAVVVDVGQHVGASTVQGAAELGDSSSAVGTPRRSGVDDLGHHGLAAAPVGLAVGGDDALVDQQAPLPRRCPSASKTPVSRGYWRG
jgi:hypothetical protein